MNTPVDSMYFRAAVQSDRGDAMYAGVGRSAYRAEVQPRSQNEQAVYRGSPFAEK